MTHGLVQTATNSHGHLRLPTRYGADTCKRPRTVLAGLLSSRFRVRIPAPPPADQIAMSRLGSFEGGSSFAQAPNQLLWPSVAPPARLPAIGPQHRCQAHERRACSVRA